MLFLISEPITQILFYIFKYFVIINKLFNFRNCIQNNIYFSLPNRVYNVEPGMAIDHNYNHMNNMNHEYHHFGTGKQLYSEDYVQSWFKCFKYRW